MAWQRGYVSDLAYLSTFCGATAPTHLRAVQLLSGQDPGPADVPYRCLEIGAGQGIGLSIISAANPKSEFVAVDYHPGQVATGARFAQSAGLSNIRIIEADLVDIAATARAELGEFQYIICHGVYSWVDDRVRGAIIEVLRQCAAPGALVYFGYNSLPGWTLIGPMQKMIAEYAWLEQGRSDDRLREAVDFLRQMAALDAKFVDLSQIPLLNNKRLDAIGAVQPESLRYLAHEYLTENWRPAYHQDVAGALSAAKLSFVNSATVTNLFLDMTVTKEQQEFLKSFPAGPFREQIKDFFSPSMYRRDVFVRGPTPISESERSRRIDMETLALIAPPEKFTFKLDCRIGEASLPKAPYEIIVDTLAKGPLSVGELRERTRAKGHDLGAEEVFGVMLASNCAAQLGDPHATAGNSVRRFNESLADFALRDATAHQLPLAAVRMQNGVSASRADFILYRVVSTTSGDYDPDQILDRVSAEFATYGDRLLEDGKPIEDDDRHRDLLRQFIEKALPAKIRIWKETGAL